MSTRAEWAALVREKLALAADQMSSAVGARVRVEYDAEANVVLPRFVVPARLEDYYTEQDKHRARKLGINGARDQATKIVRQYWKQHRDEAPTLWAFALWHDQQVRSLGTSVLSPDAFAEHMRLRRG
jgi:hypothetical protein